MPESKPTSLHMPRQKTKRRPPHIYPLTESPVQSQGQGHGDPGNCQTSEASPPEAGGLPKD